MHSRIAKLRRPALILYTVFFGVLCTGSLVWWIRSYWYIDGGMVSTSPGQHIKFHGGNGRMCVWFEHTPGPRWVIWDSRTNDWGPGANTEDRLPWFDLATFWPTMTRLYIAHWFLMIVFGAFAIAPWLNHRFSIRSLLIAVTLIALLVGAIAYEDRTY